MPPDGGLACKDMLRGSAEGLPRESPAINCPFRAAAGLSRPGQGAYWNLWDKEQEWTA